MFLKNYIGNVEAKHGKFTFFHFDAYIGLSMREYGEYSEIEFSIMERFIKPGDVVFDIGANIGSFTIPFAKKVGKNGRVYCFEPQEIVYEVLEKNIKSNFLNNTILYMNGLGKSCKTINLERFDYSQLGNFGGISLTKDSRNCTNAIIKENEEKQKVKILKLDNFLNIEKCDFLKIDVELMELDVLEGGKKFISKFQPILWVENHEEYPNKLNAYLIEKEYDIYWVFSTLYNADNYFLNENNYFGGKEKVNISAMNILAIPKNKSKNFDLSIYDKITNSYSKPSKVFFQKSLEYFPINKNF